MNVRRKTVCAALCVALVLALAPQAAGADSGASPQHRAATIRIEGAPEVFLYKASGKGNQVQLTADVGPSDTTNKTVRWISGSPTIASIDENGLVTFHGREGILLVTVEAWDGGGAFAEATIRVAKNVTGMRAALKMVYVQRGKSLRLPLVLDDATKRGYAVTSRTKWTSSNPAALEVSHGVVTASKQVTKKTKVTVTATAYNGRSLAWNVYVVPKATKLKKLAVKIPKTMRRGKTQQLKVKPRSAKATGVKVTFKSSKPSVVAVDKAGRLWAKKKGRAVITVKAGGKKIKKTIRVK